MKNEICDKCSFKKNCEFACPALEELFNINRQQKKQDKVTLIRNLARKLGIRDAEPNRAMRYLSQKIIKKYYKTFGFITEWDIKVGYVLSYETKGGEKTVYADCRKVPEIYKAYIPYDYIITFYDRNISILNDNQKKIVMLHELKHIGVGIKGLKINPHDTEDFKDILKEFGLDWNEYDKEVPDILAGD